jgi:hypothetical protein
MEKQFKSCRIGRPQQCATACSHQLSTFKKPKAAMSALAQTRTFSDVNAMSAYSQKRTYCRDTTR